MVNNALLSSTSCRELQGSMTHTLEMVVVQSLERNCSDEAFADHIYDLVKGTNLDV